MKHIHFVGIGGAGLSALAKVMLGRGAVVSGSDAAASQVTADLAKAGAKIFIGHKAEQIQGADLLVVTSAAHQDNPEVIAAHLQSIPVLRRREFLREVTAGFDTIAIAGSHGKTTTTALIGLALTAGGLDPTVVVGGVVPEWQTNARVGTGSGFDRPRNSLFVIEADEYDNAFLGLEPKIAVVTNVDYDHPDLFPSREAYRLAFAEFLNQTLPDGTIVVCGDEGAAAELAEASGRQVIRYGIGEANEWRAAEIHPNAVGGSDFTVFRRFTLANNGLARNKEQALGQVSLQIPGQHNVLNALAALVVTERMGVSYAVTAQALAQFQGVGRRFQVRGEFHGAVVVDDYAHHPTEIRATLSAARRRYPNARLIAVFQPHTYSRTRALLDDFAAAFDAADEVIVTEIYPAREEAEPGLSGAELVSRMQHPSAQFIATLPGTLAYLEKQLRPGDVLLTLGAGSVTQIAEQLAGQSYA